MAVTLTRPARTDQRRPAGLARSGLGRDGRDWPGDILEAYARINGPYTIDNAEMILDEEAVELYNGWLVWQEMTDFFERTVAGNIQAMLDLSARKAGFGAGLPDQMECLLSNGDVIKPDMALISWERAATAQPTGPSQRLILHGCPELVVETRSPSNRRAQERRKRELYFNNGAEVVWDVDMRGKRIYVYRAQNPLQAEVYEMGDVITCEPFLPGWQRRVADIFSAQASAEAVAGEVAATWIAEGRLEGHAEGIAEGRVATLRSLLPTLARYRFGAELAPEALARLHACDEAQLLHLQTRIETAATLDEWAAAIPR